MTPHALPPHMAESALFPWRPTLPDYDVDPHDQLGSPGIISSTAVYFCGWRQRLFAAPFFLNSAVFCSASASCPSFPRIMQAIHCLFRMLIYFLFFTVRAFQAHCNPPLPSRQPPRRSFHLLPRRSFRLLPPFRLFPLPECRNRRAPAAFGWFSFDPDCFLSVLSVRILNFTPFPATIAER